MIEKKYMVVVGTLYLYEVVDNTEIRVGSDARKALKYPLKKLAQNVAGFFGGDVHKSL